MRGFDRDLIRGGHYGQRSCEPHLKAEHMAAPTNAANVKKVLVNSEPSTHGTSETNGDDAPKSGAGSGCGRMADSDQTSRVEISQCNGSAYAHSIGLFEHRRGAPPLVRFG